MNRTELEKIVYELVEQVLRSLPPEIITRLAAKNTSVLQNSSQPAPFTKSLIIEEDLRQFAKQGIRDLLVVPGAIITPAAQDYARSKGIEIRRSTIDRIPKMMSTPSKANQSSVGLILSGCNESERNQILNIINDLNFAFTEYLLDWELGRNLEETAAFLARQVADGTHRVGIILHEAAFSLSVQARKMKNIRPVVYWDARSIKKRNDSAANLLFLNPKVHRLKGLNEAVREWLGSRIENK